MLSPDPYDLRGLLPRLEPPVLFCTDGGVCYRSAGPDPDPFARRFEVRTSAGEWRPCTVCLAAAARSELSQRWPELAGAVAELICRAVLSKCLARTAAFPPGEVVVLQLRPEHRHLAASFAARAILTQS